MANGWIKLHRKILLNPRSKDPEWLAVWVYMLLTATHLPIEKIFNGKRITLIPGQFISGRLQMAANTGVHESKVRRVVEWLKIDHQIDHQKGNLSSLFTILNWESYQRIDQPLEQQSANHRPTIGQQPTTLQEEEEVQEDKKYPPARQRRLPANEKEAVAMMSVGSGVPDEFVIATFLDVASRANMTDYAGNPVGVWDYHVRKEFIRLKNQPPRNGYNGKPRGPSGHEVDHSIPMPGINNLTFDNP